MENLVAIELAYINTKHPDFHKDAALVSSLLKNAEADQLRPNKRHLSGSSNISNTSTSSTILPIEHVS